MFEIGAEGSNAHFDPGAATPFVDIREKLTLAQAIVDTVRDPRGCNDQMTDGSHLWTPLASMR